MTRTRPGIPGARMICQQLAVRRQWRNIYEKWLMQTGFSDGVFGATGEHIGLVVLRGVAVLYERTVVVYGVVIHAICTAAYQCLPIAPPGWYLSWVIVTVAVQVFADVACEIIGVLQPHGKRIAMIELAISAGRRRVPHDAVVVRILAREQSRARR